MRRGFGNRMPQGLLVLFVLATVVAHAHAQITLLPGLPALVSQKPRFIAAADFNNDHFEDVVVSGSTSNTITVLFGQEGSSFGSAVNLNVGRRLRGIQAGVSSRPILQHSTLRGHVHEDPR
jgi:hypothetical protein